MTCPHTDTAEVERTSIATGEYLVITRCRLCRREWSQVVDRDADDD